MTPLGGRPQSNAHKKEDHIIHDLPGVERDTAFPNAPTLTMVAEQTGEFPTFTLKGKKQVFCRWKAKVLAVKGKILRVW